MSLFSTEVLQTAVITRHYPVVFIKDCPQANEIITQGTKITPALSRKFKGGAFSSLTAKKEFEILQSLGITRFNLHPTYMFNFRPPDGEIASLFWKKGTDISGYVSYGDEKNIFMLDYAYNELLRVRDELQAAQPKIIFASGKWALYFLTRVPKFSETVKSPYGTLLKWRASHMRLHPFFGLDDVLVLPILPLDSSMALPDKEYLSKIDAKRIRRLAHVAMTEPEKIAAELVPDEQFYIQPPAEESYIDREHFVEQRDIFYQTVLALLDSLIATCDKLPGGLRLSTDVETQAYRFIDCIGLAWAKNAGICIPFSSKRSVNYWEFEQEVTILTKLRELFLHKNCKHIGQNYQYDMQYYADNLLMKVLPEWDTMIGIHSMFSVMEKKLSLLSSVFCSYHYNWKDNFNYEKGATPAERWLYNIRDCCRTYEISDKQREMYAQADPSRTKVLQAQMYEVLPDVMRVMDAGLELDTALRDYTVRELEQRAAKLEKDILYVLGEEVCLASPKQMQRVFYTLFDCPKQYKTSVNSEGDQVVGLTVDEGALVQFYVTETLLRPLLDMMLDHRRLVKTATNIKSLTVSPDGGKLRCTLSVTGTDTYRFSSTSTALGFGTNLQTLSKGKYLRSGEKLPNTKKLIRIPAGRIGFDIDLDSADLRYVTARSGAKGLQAMFDAGKKPYVELMKEFYHDPNKTKHDREYTIFKGVCHGTNYIGSAAGIAANVGLLVHEVERIQKWYFAANPEIPAWHVWLKNRIFRSNDKWIENVFGYRRYFFNLRENNLMQIAAAWEPQSSVAILINKGMHKIFQELPDVVIRMQTHDSLFGDFPDTMPYLADEIKRCCSIELPFDKPIIIPVDLNTSTTTWGDIA